MRYLASGSLLSALLLAAAPPSSAQEIAGRYTVTVIGGRTLYAESSALEDAFTGGLEAQYNFTEWLGLGFYFMAARPTTDGSFFPLVRLEFSDTVFNTLVSQQVTQLDYGVSAAVRYPLGRFHVRGVGGIGGYTFNLDDQRIESPSLPEDRFSGLAFSAGAVLGYAFSRAGAVELRIRDFIYTDFDREKFNVSEPLLAVTDVPHPNPNPPPPEDTIHNLHFEVGFSFTLGGSR